MGVLGKANIGGVLRNLTGEGYVNIGGVLRPITIWNFNIDGVLLAGGYTWKKYNATAVYKYVEKNSTGKKVSYPAYDAVRLYESKSFNGSTGQYTLSGGRDYEWYDLTSAFDDHPKYFYLNSTNKARVGYVTYVTLNFDSDMNMLLDVTYTLYSSEQELSHYTQGTYIEDVISSNKNAYPENGRHTDGYWYVKQ